jgi:hypothetical protein
MIYISWIQFKEMHRTINRASCELKQLEANTTKGNQFKIQKQENKGGI